MNTANTGHPYFREERKRSQFKKFIRDNRESMQDVAKRAREWRLEQGDSIIVIGHAWSLQPTADEEHKGPSSYDNVLTITYVDAKEGGPKQSVQQAYPEPPITVPDQSTSQDPDTGSGGDDPDESGKGPDGQGAENPPATTTPTPEEKEEEKQGSGDPNPEGQGTVPELGDTDSFPPADGNI